MSHIPHTQNVYFFRGIHFSLSQIATSVQWVLAWNVFNKSHFFSLELGANRCAKGATLDDWEELIRALGEKAIDFTVFLCLSVLFRAFRQLSGIPQQQATAQSTGCFINQYDLLEHWFFCLTLQHLQPHSILFPLGSVDFSAPTELMQSVLIILVPFRKIAAH